jgi:hypothetical protein
MEDEPVVTTETYHSGAKTTGAIVLLWAIIVIIAILVIVSAVIFTVVLIIRQSDPTILDSTSYCKDLTQGLPDISNQAFCTGRGNVKYNRDLLVDSSPAAIGYQQVCSQFCSVGYYDKSTDTCKSDNDVEIERTSNCVTATRPDNCYGPAKPISISNGTPYYAYQADIVGC